jgi:hypothetical protein
MIKILKLATIVLLASITLNVSAKTAKCSVYSAGQADFVGNCKFLAEKNGTFTLSSTRPNQPLYDDILVVSVAVTKKNNAEVYGLTDEGINSRWGHAVRDKSNLSCWKSDDFKVCAK